MALTLAACGRSPSAPSAKDAADSRRSRAALPRSSTARRSSRIRSRSSGFKPRSATTSTQALWDEVANLFADDGTIELALDGVYVGKARVREYLRHTAAAARARAKGTSTSTCK